jgi:hypothetical protein
MAPPLMFNPVMFWIEFAYTLVVVLLCFLVYYKTREMYELTKYKGIQYFRTAFFFFSLAYAARFILQLIQLSMFALDYFMPQGLLFPVCMLIVSYLSTMAIFYLVYSTVWKKIRYEHFLAFSNAIAVGLSFVAFFSHSPGLLSLVQLPLILAMLVTNFRKEDGKQHARSHTRLLYFLISLFWLTSLFAVGSGPRWFMPFELRIALQAISLGVFIFLVYKVSKWTR